MHAIISWVTTIIVFLLFTIVIDLLLPSSSFQKYVKMVIGLILLLIMLSPLLSIFSLDVDRLLTTVTTGGSEQQEMMKNELEQKKKEIQASQRAYILEQMAVQMKKQVAGELMKQYGLTVQQITLQTTERSSLPTSDDIQTIEVVVSQQHTPTQQTIQPVIIDVSKPISTDGENEALRKTLASFFATKWGVHEEKIIVQMEGRDWGDASVH
ncbi:stage III sporulation protein AF [Anoxybacillus voinovskiensis]|uniref:Stage III sporulation protein AF n=1 Tax=Anoxybacteroides voinovskiense TaxID=230470 RepID=A0A840DTY5_9BACL|nr:stage III sporulation protein AF [Anoxybacillus voinovskiensis]MBB4073488.1 stage III sporulation protein AF [Anoxybacillus voinovskiensis]GGJ62442.1 stage III sporulation protein AF [Anoxybacillus voinovskiensis]